MECDEIGKLIERVSPDECFFCGNKNEVFVKLKNKKVRDHYAGCPANTNYVIEESKKDNYIFRPDNDCTLPKGHYISKTTFKCLGCQQSFLRGVLRRKYPMFGVRPDLLDLIEKDENVRKIVQFMIKIEE
jgi:hypothetical protein